MNKLLIRVSVFVISIFLSVLTYAQQALTTPINEENLLRSNGKIYVVVAICVTILLGLFFYVITIDRKISRLEKEQ